jgi:hypothetical protein
MTLKEKLHRLIDDLPKREHPAAQRYLEYLRDAGSDPVVEAMRRAPVDDEPFTAEDAMAVAESERALARGEWKSHAAVRPRRTR